MNIHRIIRIPLVVLCVLLSACAMQPAMEEESGAEADAAEPSISAAKSAAQPSAEAAPAELAEDVAAGAPPAGAQAAGESETEAAARIAAAARQPTVRYLSADDSNSAASAVIARKLIAARRVVHPALVRTYEFLNYYSFDYPAPVGEPIRIIPQLRSLEQEGSYSLQVAVRSEDRALADLPPFNITLLLDSSGSMAGPSMKLAKATVRSIASRLRPQDRIALVTFDREAREILGARTLRQLSSARLSELLDGIRANDVTNLEAGIIQAYRTASASYDYRSLNRVVLISDGAANAGELAADTIARHAEDSDRQGIYLAGIGMGEGFNDMLMNTVTDRGRGAYLFLDSEEEIGRLMDERIFLGSFDLAVKDVRLKMVMPPGWSMEAFHGEQVSDRAEDVVPQYLAPNDQMIYHLTVASGQPAEQVLDQEFEFEAEYSPLGGRGASAGSSAGGGKRSLTVKATVGQMLAPKGQEQPQILKGDAVVAYAEMLKSIQLPLDAYRAANVERFEKTYSRIEAINARIRDAEVEQILILLARYGDTLRYGETFPGSRDGQEDSADAALGLNPARVRSVEISGDRSPEAVATGPRLLSSQRLVPLEGYKFLLLSTGPVGNPYPAGGEPLSKRMHRDPAPSFMGGQALRRRGQRVHDLHQVRLELTAPDTARSFSFDFNFFSSEYPEYVNQNYNDTFYAVIEAPSTNNGSSTNIAFDANNNSIEVDNNYFQNPFHPIPNTGTGFDAHGSTGWLRTSWPIRGGERFTLTFSIHDEGDGIYDSLVVLDNFQWHEYDAVGTTDPLN